MSLQTCITEAKAWADKNSELKLNKAELEELGKVLEAANNAGATKAEKMKLMQDAVLRRIEMTQEARRGENYINALTHARNLDNIQKNIELWGKKESSGVAAFEAHTTGESSRPGFGVNNDPLAASRGNMTRYAGFLENALSKTELKIFKALSPGDPLMEKIYTELYALRRDTPLGLTGSDIALSIAKKFREAQDAVFKEAQAVNPYLKENQLYLSSRSHNRALISKVSEAQWVADAQAHFGQNLMGDPAAIKEMLGKTYRGIVAGLPPEATDMSPRFWEPPGTGGSQAIQNAGQRVFVANDAKAEFEYNKKYGDSLYNSFMKQAQRQADYVPTVNKWGTKASENYSKLWNATYKSLDTDAQKAYFLKNKQYLQKKFDDTQASRYNEAWTVAGRVAQGLLSADNLSMTGNHVPRVLSSGPAMLAQIRHGQGLNIFEAGTSIAQSFAKLMGNLGDAGTKEMKNWGISSMSVMRDLSNQLVAGNGQPLGAPAKLARVLGKLTLADYTTNAYKFMMAEHDTRFFGGQADVSFKDMHPVLQETLQRHNLHGPRWEVLRQAVDEKGRLTSEGLKNVSDEQINTLNTGKKANATTAQQIRGQLAQDYGTLLNRRASMTVGESNAASRSRAYGTSDINTVNGIGRNFFYQFKQASDVRQQLLQQIYRSGGGDTSNMTGTMEYMLHMALAGAVGQQLVEIGSNRKPLDMKDPKIVAHMIESTGLLGMYGSLVADYLTAPDGNKMRTMLEGDFIGAAGGTVLKGAQAAWQTGHGVVQAAQGKDRQGQYGGKEWARFLHGITPDQNLFYAKGALDYTLFNTAHNFLGDSGYLSTLHKQMQKSHDISGNRQEPIW